MIKFSSKVHEIFQIYAINSQKAPIWLLEKELFGKSIL